MSEKFPLTKGGNAEGVGVVLSDAGRLGEQDGSIRDRYADALRRSLPEFGRQPPWRHSDRVKSSQDFTYAAAPFFKGELLRASESLNTKLASTLHDLTIETTNNMANFNLAGSLWKDFKYGARQLRSSPGFALAAILSLALGIGANSAIFTFVIKSCYGSFQSRARVNSCNSGC